ncbi:IclR family transcriptional regulator [Nocardioides panacisoli]|uniref:IclR family transcriptional regulator n=1 Tax=Nocardioides panacisoli TaxID=627624 RepID=UPI001C6302E0|nr:IclR family transcriptional regulator [Nocardioides panacisoli]QYJ03097.1 IclR family transcriptional regulator [Nocardioides panacisoli]
MTLIIDRFRDRETRLTLEEVARSTGLPRSTAHRILDQLVRLEWLDHSAHGYGLGRRSLVLGGRGGTDDLRAAASPHLHDLLLRTGAVVHLGVLDEGRVRYLDKLGGRFAANVPSRVGSTAPAHCTGLGKAMLAWLEPEEVEELLGGQPLVRTEATINGPAALHRDLARVRSRGGLALERGECVPDIACLAAAIRGPRGPVAAVSVVARAGSTLERVGPVVLDTARRIGVDLFGEIPGIRRDQCRARGIAVTG